MAEPVLKLDDPDLDPRKEEDDPGRPGFWWFAITVLLSVWLTHWLFHVWRDARFVFYLAGWDWSDRLFLMAAFQLGQAIACLSAACVALAFFLLRHSRFVTVLIVCVVASVSLEWLHMLMMYLAFDAVPTILRLAEMVTVTAFGAGLIKFVRKSRHVKHAFVR